MTNPRSEPKKPRLLVLASTYPRWRDDPEPGFVHELAKRLTEEFEVSVLGPHAPGALVRESMDGVQVRRYRYAPAASETLVNDGGIITNLKRQPWKWLLVPAFLIGLTWRLWQLVRTFRPDVIHAHWLLPQGLAVALMSTFTKAPPFLVTSHGADLFALKALPMQALKRFVVRRAAAVTVVSTAMREELVRIGADATKISMLSMGVDLDGRFTPDPAVKRSRAEILFVGRLVEKKGIRYLIGAMPAILSKQPDAHLTIAGFGPELDELRLQAARLGLQSKVVFLGAVSQADLPTLYRRAAVLAAPFVEARSGDQEGLGLVLVEAIGCGCPIVTTRLPAVRETFRQWQSCLVAPGQSDQLAEQLCQVLGSVEGAEREASAMREALRPRFDWNSVARGYADLLKASLSTRP